MKSVLIIEDDPDIALGLRIWLEGRFLVTTAPDAFLGRQLARTNRPDAILLDLGLPAGSGFDVLADAKADPKLAGVPIIVLTGRDSAAALARARELGAAAFFTKPAEQDLLLNALEDVMRVPCQRPNILVVEDDADTRHGLVVSLVAMGFGVVAAEDGAQAFAVAVREQPDAILLDLALPAGGGLSVLERVRSHPKLGRTPVVVLSGRQKDDAYAGAVSLGANGFLQKPSDSRSLRRALEAVL